ncbi:hypothetical protein JP75_09070 [Devosia riboflavina]|uniref:DUF1345 domain-containing protein n=1 Tax=Devosia riboflavina TaxID=46914 RepID=A0A087M456_9HYPH|nr:DUF1345 domain-containing protein [Devosia riboflavina]KFL31659.1 hypothetical protein JP75_09070 [Devosia riboflavina]
MSTRLVKALGHHVAPPRFVLFAATMLVLLVLAVFAGIELQIGVLASFDVATLVFLVSALPLLNDDVVTMRSTSAANDANRAGLLAITLLVLLIVLIAVGALIAHPDANWIEVPLILVSLGLAWVFANTIFAFHYAHLYYQQRDGKDWAGLRFPDGATPDYWDFLYFSFTLGMTFQTSDVTIDGSHMRRIALAHGVAAFLFNLGILAFAINTVGSLYS